MGRTNSAEWKRIRRQVLDRDLNTCAYCNDVATEVDHIIPVARGGSDDEWNLQALCRYHNRSKGTKDSPGRLTASPQPKAARTPFFGSPRPHPPAGEVFSPIRRFGPEGS